MCLAVYILGEFLDEYKSSALLSTKNKNNKCFYISENHLEIKKKMTQKQRTFRECQKDKYFKYWTGSTLKNIKEAEKEKYKKYAGCQEKQNMGTNQRVFF